MNQSKDQYNPSDVIKAKLDRALEARIMRRVHRIYFLRRALSPSLCRMYGLVLVLFGMMLFVSVPSVLTNMSSFAPGAALSYMWSAFMHTEIVVQALCALGFSLAVWLSWDIARMIGGVSLRRVQ